MAVHPSSANWLENLRVDLKSSVQASREGYSSARVLVLYWEAGGVGFKDEAKAVQSEFKNLFNFTVTEVPIQSKNGYFQVLGEVSRALAQDEVASGSSLLIVHYGGHGDLDDDRHNGQEGRAVWSAHNHGDPVLKWYEIQEQISHSDTDILLLLDCCYAAQAARDRQHGKGRMEVLAAAAMGVKTRGAGIKSFTSILLREMRLAVEKDGFVSPKDLHGQLCNRKQDLFATPVHISLKPGRHPLRLMPLRGHAPKFGKDSEAMNSSFLHLLVEIKENMTLDSAGKINEWLREDIPDFVSSLDVFDKTEHIQKAVKDLDRGQKEFTKHIDIASRDEINQAWATVLTLVQNYEKSKLSMVEGGLMNDAAKKRRALDFMSQLDIQGEGVINALENGILAAFKPEQDDVLTETSEDENIQALGIDSQLRIRRMIVQSEVPQNSEDHATVEGQTFHLCTTGSLIMQEVRPYDSYMSAADLPALQYRLGLLAKLLSTPKSREFRSLQCTKWSHQESAHTYTLDFEVPSTYTQCQYMDLNMSIHNAKGKHRPTLNERVRMALTIAKAIRKWHLVGWVHQGISSHNIIFFFRESCSIERPDYSEPFLKGFEFSRPDSDPSIGRAVDDMELNVYRHPNRQGVARKGHQKKYDIYSLGVVLLEIGLWQRAREMLPIKAGQALPTPLEIKSILEKNCSHRLSHFAGTSYQAAVSRCLSLDFAVSMDDDSGSRLTAAFEEQVIKELTRSLVL